MANFDLHSWLTGYIFGVVGKELKLPVLEHPAVQWRLSPSIITTDGAEANDRVWGFSNIDDEFILVTTSSSKLYSSYDGVIWNYVTDIPFSCTNEITRINGVYYNIPTYSNTLYYSEDLITWTACSFPSGHPINTVGSYQYSNGKFFCSSAGNGNTYLYYSDDGKSWYSKLLSSGPMTTGSTWWGSFSFKYYPELSIFLGVAARLDYLYYSTNGTSWTYVASGVNYAPNYNNGVFLYYVSNIDANPRYLEVYKSEDGKNWHCTYHEDLDDNASDYSQLGFTYLNGIWYMCSTGCEFSFRSVDNGETWESFDVLPEVYGGVYAFGKYWLRNEILTSSPYGAVSDDGEHWEVIPDARIVNAEIDDGLALDGLLSYSTDGINWYDTNILTIKQETPSDHMFGSDSPVKFKNMWVSIYYKENSRNIYQAKYYESRLLYMPVK